jgi:uncharacterized protein with GYD domain
VKGLMAAPEDREKAVRKLVEAAGGKFVSFYITTGDTDFMLIADGEAEAVLAGMMAAGAAGTITDTNTVRAWTTAEFKGIAEKAAKTAKAYRAPG